MMEVENEKLGIGIEAPPRNTSKIALPESSTIRKIENGRANLFVESTGYQELKCSSSISQHISSNCIYHSHKLNNRTKENWPQKTEFLCWHCCTKFDTPPISIPKNYDTKEQNYIVYGSFCGFSCGKAHILETDTFNTGLQLTMFDRMIREVYDIKDDIIAAPPRLSLDIFGGPYSIDVFRNNKNEIKIFNPPFVCSYMVVEERKSAHNVSSYAVNATGSVKGLKRATGKDKHHMIQPEVSSEPSPYELFLAAKGTRIEKGESSSSGTKKKDSSANMGTLHAFMKT